MIFRRTAKLWQSHHTDALIALAVVGGAVALAAWGCHKIAVAIGSLP